ncbi:MAG: hypothetical protein NTY83_03805, partial [Candidatus Micrarchaeota archaeon]|nr:hypothetical protein [Candidatus Micrarchaeota archaeon]
MQRRRALFLDADYAIKRGQTYARLFVKGKKSTRLHYPYDPYFYADVNEGERGAIENLSVKARDGQVVRPKRTEFVEKILFGDRKRLLRIYCHEPRHVPILREAIPFPCYESEIPFGRRFMMDLGIVPLSVISYERE